MLPPPCCFGCRSNTAERGFPRSSFTYPNVRSISEHMAFKVIVSLPNEDPTFVREGSPRVQRNTVPDCCLCFRITLPHQSVTPIQPPTSFSTMKIKLAPAIWPVCKCHVSQGFHTCVQGNKCASVASLFSNCNHESQGTSGLPHDASDHCGGDG